MAAFSDWRPAQSSRHGPVCEQAGGLIRGKQVGYHVRLRHHQGPDQALRLVHAVHGDDSGVVVGDEEHTRHVRRLTQLEGKKLRDELAELMATIKELESILGSKAKLLGVIKTELGALRLVQAHSRPRRPLRAEG
jgi:hypothetical protein